MSTTVTNQTLQELLDSDDELPTTYDDIADTPAYQNDSRFLPIKFHWIDNKKPAPWLPNKQLLTPKNTLYELLNEEIVSEKTKDLKSGEKILIKKGILNKQDVYCLQSIESLTSDATILWFINFLTYKDLQSPYKYLSSCLVGNVFPEKFKHSPHDWESKQYKYEVLVK